MKAKLATIIGMTTLVTGTALMAGPFIVVQPPSVVIQSPVVVPVAPAVTVGVGVPDSYVWDGYENVGLVGNQYCYLGANNVWLPLDTARTTRFNGWQRGHPDWRDHATRNVKYRRDVHGHDVPVRDLHAAPDHDQNHDADHHDDHDQHDH
jgi:hypothetical protein